MPTRCFACVALSVCMSGALASGWSDQWLRVRMWYLPHPRTYVGCICSCSVLQSGRQYSSGAVKSIF